MADPTRKLMLAGTTLLVLSASVAAATPTSFGFTGGIMSYAAPITGLYSILVFGAQSGRGGVLGNAGGLGAQVSGGFMLTAGEMLTIAVAGAGSDGAYGGSGAGGSFVVRPGNTPLAIAGGGGGAGSAHSGTTGGGGQASAVG